MLSHALLRHALLRHACLDTDCARLFVRSPANSRQRQPFPGGLDLGVGRRRGNLLHVLLHAEA